MPQPSTVRLRNWKPGVGGRYVASVHPMESPKTSTTVEVPCRRRGEVACVAGCVVVILALTPGGLSIPLLDAAVPVVPTGFDGPADVDGPGHATKVSAPADATGGD